MSLSFLKTLGTDRSGVIAGAPAQVVAAANPSRHSMRFQNISANDMWVNETGGTAAVNGTGSYKVVAGAVLDITTRNAVSVLGTAADQYTATEA